MVRVLLIVPSHSRWVVYSCPKPKRSTSSRVVPCRLANASAIRADATNVSDSACKSEGAFSLRSLLLVIASMLICRCRAAERMKSAIASSCRKNACRTASLKSAWRSRSSGSNVISPPASAPSSSPYRGCLYHPMKVSCLVITNSRVDALEGAHSAVGHQGATHAGFVQDVVNHQSIK